MVRLALKVFVQNNRDFAGVILLYKHFEGMCDLLPIGITCTNVAIFIVIVVRTSNLTSMPSKFLSKSMPRI